ncbi:MAG: hypothetical protein ACRCXX_11580 [Cetobacterium sp.]|uniref:hypothetical protein n=1 Tax=Cetobacterium sp. TaxID=2071632 RepID=UPI003F34348F
MLVINNNMERFIEISKKDYKRVAESYDMSYNTYFPVKSGLDILNLSPSDLDIFLENRRIFYVKNNNLSHKSKLVEFHFIENDIVPTLDDKPYCVPKYICHYVQNDFIKVIRSLKAKWVKRGKMMVEKGMFIGKK